MSINTKIELKDDFKKDKKIRMELKKLAIKLKLDPTDAELYIHIKELYNKLEKT